MPEIPKQTLKTGDRVHGFTVRKVSRLDEMYLIAYQLEHDRTGAKLLHFHCADDESLFSINFPTPPEDDTGLPHIMEHAVLSGSKRFPVRDPFFEMYKMSMATFINAMTGADCTYYPVCSNVKRDLFNLADVYFDAVFHPLLDPETFKREGHHLIPADLEDPTGQLAVNGIVYNEMKAAFSKPEARLGRLAFRNLFPDTCYGNESGGDPEAIPDLTYEQFMAFHRHWYHPSNAHFVFYGNIPTLDFLYFLEDRLAPFARQDVAPVFGSQPPWQSPRVLIETYDIGDENPGEKTYLQLNWLIPMDLDAEQMILMEILGLVLVGDDAAPLKKAIIDSGLGQDLLPSGTMQVGRDGMFCIGIRGSEANRAAAFRDLVLGELKRLAAAGIEPALVASAFRRYSYSLREIKHSQPLHVADQALTSWIQGGDPLLFLRLQELLETCRKRCEADPDILAGLIRARLVDNPHRLDVSMVPDAAWRKRTEAAFAERMQEKRATLTDAQMLNLAAEAARLEEVAGTANSPEALATLPQLQRGDLPARPTRIPTTVEKLPTGNDFLRNDVFANGVNYLEVYIDLDGLPEDLWLHVPRYIDTLKKLGAGECSYVEMARRTTAATGAFDCMTSYAGHAADPMCTRKGVVIALKALDGQMRDALAVLHDRLMAPNPNDPGRFRDVVKQALSRMQTSLINGGPSTVATQLSGAVTEVGFLHEKASGLSQYAEIRRLAGSFDASFAALADRVGQIARFILNRNRFTFSFTGSDEAAGICRRTLAGWLADMPASPVAPQGVGFAPAERMARIGLAGPMQVAHCVQLLPALHISHPDAPLLSLAMAMLRIDYMVSELRFKGNAYGASCSYDGRTITLSTYADPHVKRTLEVFAAITDYVRSAPWTDVELTRGIISTAKNYVRPIRPEDATASALTSHITGETGEIREARYRTVLAATPEKLKEVVLRVLESGFARAPVGVLSNRQKLQEANGELGDAPLLISDLLE